MSWGRVLGYSLLWFAVIHLFFLYRTTVEHFTDAKSQESNDVANLMTAASEIFCPAIDSILDNLQSKYAGTDEQKRDEARLELVKEAKGAMFPCPVPADPLATPADIDTRILLSTQFLERKLIETKEKIQKSLDCQSEEEGFEDVCSGEEEIKKEDIQRKEAAIAATKRCVSPKEISEEDKQKILQSRLLSLKRVMGNSFLVPKFATIKSLTAEIKDLKDKAEKGELKSNCPT